MHLGIPGKSEGQLWAMRLEAEGVTGVLWAQHQHEHSAPQAARYLQITSKEYKELGRGIRVRAEGSVPTPNVRMGIQDHE